MTLDDAGYERGPTGDYEYEELAEDGHVSSDQDQELRMFSLADDVLDRRVETTGQQH